MARSGRRSDGSAADVRPHGRRQCSSRERDLHCKKDGRKMPRAANTRASVTMTVIIKSPSSSHSAVITCSRTAADSEGRCAHDLMARRWRGVAAWCGAAAPTAPRQTVDARTGRRPGPRRAAVPEPRRRKEEGRADPLWPSARRSSHSESSCAVTSPLPSPLPSRHPVAHTSSLPSATSRTHTHTRSPSFDIGPGGFSRLYHPAWLGGAE